jgi:hypothetical protein
MAKISARGDDELARFRDDAETVEVVVTKTGRVLRKSLGLGDGFKFIGKMKPADRAVSYYAAQGYRRVR